MTSHARMVELHKAQSEIANVSVLMAIMAIIVKMLQLVTLGPTDCLVRTAEHHSGTLRPIHVNVLVQLDLLEPTARQFLVKLALMDKHALMEAFRL